MKKPREYNPRTIFVPIERRVAGTPLSTFRTSDHRVYVRGEDGVVCRALKKERGKSARRRDKRRRRHDAARATRP